MSDHKRGQQPLKAIGLSVAGSGFLAWGDAISKWLSESFPIGQILCLRALFIMVPLLLIVWRGGDWGTLRAVNRKHQAIRAFLFVGTTFGAIVSVWLLPLSTFVAFIFASPILVAALSVPFLGERVGWRRWTAIVVGFIGILIIVRPSSDSLEWGMLAALTTTIFGATRDLYTRRISRTEHSNAVLFYSAIAASLTGLVTLPLGWSGLLGESLAWEPMALGMLAVFVIAGTVNGGAHFLIIESLRLGEAALVSPFRYTMMIWAMLADIVVWGTLPDWPVFAGSALVVASGLYILRREQLKKPAA